MDNDRLLTDKDYQGICDNCGERCTTYEKCDCWEEKVAKAQDAKTTRLLVEQVESFPDDCGKACTYCLFQSGECPAWQQLKESINDRA